MQQFLEQYLAAHGYWVLFVWTFMEGEAGLILAGFLAFQGHLNIFGVIATAFLGSFAGDQFYFYLGRWYGHYLLRIFTTLARKFRKGLRLIEKYGSFVAFISRFTYGFRIILPVILGITRFPAPRFLWLNLISAFVWSVIFSLIGYLFGKSASLLIKDVKKYEPYLLLALISLIACMWLSHFVHLRWRKRHSLARLRRLKKARMREKSIKR